MTEHSHITNLVAELAELEAEKARLNIALDSGDMNEDAYEAIYGPLFDMRCNVEDALLAAPISSADDLIAKLQVLRERAQLDQSTAGYLQRLAGQVKEWRSRGA